MDLPQGALARYERDVAEVAYVVSRRGAVPEEITEGEEVLVPTFEIAAYPTIRLSEIKARRFYIVDRAQIKAKEAIQKEEDTNIFRAITAAANSEGDQIVTNIGTLTTNSLNTGFRLIEQHDLVTTKIVLHANQFASIRAFGKDFYDEATQREIITTGLYGHLYTADIHVSSRMDVNTIALTASPDTVGAFPIRQDITVLPADSPQRLRLGWVVFEEVGIVIMNLYAISIIEVTAST